MTNKNEAEIQKILAQLHRMPNETPQSIQAAVKQAHNKARTARKERLIAQLVDLKFLAGEFYTDEVEPIAPVQAEPEAKGLTKEEWLKTHKDLRGFALAKNREPQPAPVNPVQIEKGKVLSFPEQKSAEERNAALQKLKKERSAAVTRSGDWNEVAPGVAFRVGGRRDDDRVDARSGKNAGSIELETANMAVETKRAEKEIGVDLDTDKLADIEKWRTQGDE